MRRRLPLFVLPTVLIPEMHLPLHVFEPRYRRLVATCLEGDRRFGVICHDPDRLGPFAVREGLIGCTAEILKFRPLPDGRSLLLARGVTRFRVADGIEAATPYAQALVERMDDLPGTAARPARRLASIELFHTAAQSVETTSPPDLSLETDLSFQLGAALRTDPDWRQRLLETRSEAARLDDIDRLLRSWIGA